MKKQDKWELTENKLPNHKTEQEIITELKLESARLKYEEQLARRRSTTMVNEQIDIAKLRDSEKALFEAQVDKMRANLEAMAASNMGSIDSPPKQTNSLEDWERHIQQPNFHPDASIMLQDWKFDNESLCTRIKRLAELLNKEIKARKHLTQVLTSLKQRFLIISNSEAAIEHSHTMGKTDSCDFEIGDVYLHPEHGPVYLESGYFQNEYGISNHFTFRQIGEDGRLGTQISEYGQPLFKLTHTKYIEITPTLSGGSTDGTTSATNQQDDDTQQGPGTDTGSTDTTGPASKVSG